MRQLKICHISDTHNLHKEVKIPECDVLIHSGDFSMMGYRHEVESFMRWFKLQAQATYKIFIAGNHDLSFDPQRGGNKGSKPAWLVEELAFFLEDPELTNNFYLENNSCEIQGVKFWGSPTSSWFHGDRWAFNVKEPEAEELYSQIPHKTDIVITHGPAYTYGDWCINCACYVGDHVLARYIKKVKPLLHLFGHIHESYGMCTDGNTHYVNSCNTDLSYQIVNKPVLLNVNFDEKEVEPIN